MKTRIKLETEKEEKRLKTNVRRGKKKNVENWFYFSFWKTNMSSNKGQGHSNVRWWNVKDVYVLSCYSILRLFFFLFFFFLSFLFFKWCSSPSGQKIDVYWKLYMLLKGLKLPIILVVVLQSVRWYSQAHPEKFPLLKNLEEAVCFCFVFYLFQSPSLYLDYIHLSLPLVFFIYSIRNNKA